VPPGGPPPATPIDEVVDSTQSTQVSPTQPSSGSGSSGSGSSGSGSADTGGAGAGTSSGTTISAGNVLPTTRIPLRPYPKDNPPSNECPWYERFGGPQGTSWVRDLCTQLPYKIADLEKRGVSKSSLHSTGDWLRQRNYLRNEWERDFAAHHDEL